MDLDPALLASCCYARFHPRSGVVRIVRAGHLPPLLRLPDGQAEVLDVPGGPLLGIDAEPTRCCGTPAGPPAGRDIALLLTEYAPLR
ncbi:SpoIIE family protein phosphatase [Streptomyces sp. NPDC015127]|uniref:SpoIIE family protein phosphatase n=1 Tax=Streptomyces sp. NPDC015127 TaxID=3364939 RepID=UPI0036F69899